MTLQTRGLLITTSILFLILFCGVLLGLAFGTAKFERVCAEAMVNVMIGEYKVK